ncbi:MAG: hypothetical protein PVF17_10115 [Ignavibacteria bacterium]
MDHAGNVEEAIEIINNRDVFDQNVNTISHHFLISDQSGVSAVAEYSGGEWYIIITDRNWQIATNTVIYNVSEEWKRNECNRYRVADNYLNEANGQVTWQQGMEVLNRVSVYETQWSALYDLTEQRMYITLYRNYDHIFSVDL